MIVSQAKARLGRVLRRVAPSSEAGGVVGAGRGASVISDEPPGQFLWLDRRSALPRIDQEVQSGHLTSAEGDLLRCWATHGYAIIEQCVEPELLDGVVREIDRVWQERWHAA